jgi:hypothetical protein
MDVGQPQVVRSSHYITFQVNEQTWNGCFAYPS